MWKCFDCIVYKYGIFIFIGLTHHYLYKVLELLYSYIDFILVVRILILVLD